MKSWLLAIGIVALVGFLSFWAGRAYEQTIIGFDLAIMKQRLQFIEQGFCPKQRIHNEGRIRM